MYINVSSDVWRWYEDMNCAMCNVQTIKKQNIHKKQKHFYCDCIMNYVIVLWNIPLLVRYPQEYVLLSIILLNRLPLHLVNVYGTTSYFALVTIHVLLSTRATSYDRRTDGRWGRLIMYFWVSPTKIVVFVCL